MWSGLNRRRWALIAASGVAVVAASVVVVVEDDDPHPQFCTLDALIGDDGQGYIRDPDQGCQFVDEFGHVIHLD